MTPTLSHTSELSLPELASDYALSAEQLNSFREQGYILLRGVASLEEIAAYRPLLNRAVERFNTETRALEERDTYGKAFLQIVNLWERDEEVRRFSLARRFAKIAADLMGVDGVRIYHDQALFKEPGGGPTPWHQDHYYWPLETDHMITMWMPLVPVSAGMGPPRFASGSHRLGYLGDLPISDKSEEELSELIAERGFSAHLSDAFQPGDATFHAGWMLHSTPGNSTSVMREAMAIIYHEMKARLIEPDSASRQADLERWFPGLKPGDVAASQLNPIVYAK
jgi:ectoine hydroxylase-related dioxygenase (phytanoyl-CoA dioxygenase family)